LRRGEMARVGDGRSQDAGFPGFGLSSSRGAHNSKQTACRCRPTKLPVVAGRTAGRVPDGRGRDDAAAEAVRRAKGSREARRGRSGASGGLRTERAAEGEEEL
jgi:hypothetical protein